MALITKEQRARNRFQKTIRSLVFKQYDGIVTMCESIARKWQTGRIPLKTLNEIVDMAMVISKKLDGPTLEKVEIFNGTLKTFKDVCKIQSEETMKDGNISINEIKMFVKRFKDVFIKAQDNAVH